MVEKQKNILIIFLVIFVATAIISIFLGSNKQTVRTSSGVLSNKTIGWGLKRGKDHAQPNMGAENRKLIEEYEGLAIGNETDKFVYLTFDSGYEAGYTKNILKVLQNNNVKASFFITAHYLNSSTELVKQIIEEGHIVRKP